MTNQFEPFCTAILRTLRRSLLPTNLPRPLPAHTHSMGKGGKLPNESAILIPLMNIKDQPHILLEVRGRKMRTHAGEVSFPGGKSDRTDESLIHTALRETQEELSIPPSHVEILGMLKPEYSLGNKSRVWPFVGFIHSDPQPFPSIPQTLPSLPINQIVPNPEEVQSIVTLPLSSLNKPEKLAIHYFRLDLGKPYYRIDCSDYLLSKSKSKSSSSSSSSKERGNAKYTGFNEETRNDIDPSQSQKQRPVGIEENGEFSAENLEIWGLSGWFLNRLCERAGWLDPPPKGISPED